MAKTVSIILALMFPVTSIAAFKCGPWVLDTVQSGETTLNGQITNTQKVTFLRQRDDYANMKLDMALAPARDGNMYGFEFIKRDGKAFLNVELLRASMDAPRHFATYDCVKVK
ncbi:MULTISPECIES: hypothetical protein [unclassified Serratia (in: enterobacteria)]|uniref:hypothetical protein n=1 Tax=unclassified Serratia (in: enterobacteria) TaxID=2647522 RepID=UPI000506761C|nr:MULTISPECIES: hypothetical protein [unclassified Serratia (in: enterobacteria)]KFK92007.1 hypothetical protein JV45_23190 [Serratia sp. Ag2]KFK98408.1 hypothetical protein IV04_12560 [Serratia sp. Ag1]